MSEQLSMNFADTHSPDDSINNENEVESYEPLDFQLAGLMQELNGQENKAQNKILETYTLEISKHTREGQIAIACADHRQAELLQTNVVGQAGDYKPLILDQGYLYLRRYWQYQTGLADQIKTRMMVTQMDANNLDETAQQWAQQRLDDYFPDNNSDEINWQKTAASRALENKFLIISGGPGTGKTTTITRILALLIEQYFKYGKKAIAPSNNDDIIIRHSPHPNGSAKAVVSPSSLGGDVFKILLAAPTGKAAIRMLDSIRTVINELKLPELLTQQMPSEASTIHKLLGYKHNSVQFKHNRHNPLDTDVVLVDEASMIDIALMSKLLEAIPEHAKLILIGDKDQLSSVETGSVFADICAGLSNSENLVTLKKNWRFSADSDIGESAIAANRGDSTALLSVLQDQNRTGCELIEPEAIRDAELIKPWTDYFEVLNNPASTHQQIFATFNDYRILCALRRGLNGSSNMSSRIETALAKQNLIKPQQKNKQQSQSWYHGRPIMITQNSYNKGLFNGDTGITLIKNGEVKVWFPDDSLSTDGCLFKNFSPVRLPAHETTWAITIHKSQGSEFNQVVLILPHEEMPLLTRQLVYTGITRAKEKVGIVASEAVLAAGVKAQVVRATMINQNLKNG